MHVMDELGFGSASSDSGLRRSEIIETSYYLRREDYRFEHVFGRRGHFSMTNGNRRGPMASESA